MFHADVYVPPPLSVQRAVAGAVNQAIRGSSNLGAQFGIITLVGDGNGGAIGASNGVRYTTPACPNPILRNNWIRKNIGHKVTCSMNAYVNRVSVFVAVTTNLDNTLVSIRAKGWL